MTDGRRRRIVGGALLVAIGLVALWLARDPRSVPVPGSEGPDAVAAEGQRARAPSGRGAADRSRLSRAAPAVPRFSPPATPARFEPNAYRSYRARRQTAVQLFQQEVRAERWAGQMEDLLRTRFHPRTLRELNIPSLSVDEVECRTSSCRLEVSWDERDHRTTQALSERVTVDPLSLVTSSTGPLAVLESRQRPGIGQIAVPGSWSVRRREDGRLAVTDVLLFGEEDMQPEGYRTWVGWVADNMRSAPNLVSW